jgi:hypothetical protein
MRIGLAKASDINCCVLTCSYINCITCNHCNQPHNKLVINKLVGNAVEAFIFVLDMLYICKTESQLILQTLRRMVLNWLSSDHSNSNWETIFIWSSAYRLICLSHRLMVFNIKIQFLFETCIISARCTLLCSRTKSCQTTNSTMILPFSKTWFNTCNLLFNFSHLKTIFKHLTVVAT